MFGLHVSDVALAKADSIEAKCDAAADVVVDAKGVVVSVSARAKKYVKMGEKLSSSQMDDLSEAGFSVREQK